MPSKRPLQVADRIKEIVANALESRVKDPRLGFVTITDVRVTGDLQQASIFYTVLGDNAAHEATAAALSSAKGMLRSEVGRALGLRITPSINSPFSRAFYMDLQQLVLRPHVISLTPHQLCAFAQLNHSLQKQIHPYHLKRIQVMV